MLDTRVLTISISHILIMLIDKSSQPLAFLEASDHIMDKIFSPVISTSDSEELHLETKLGKARKCARAHTHTHTHTHIVCDVLENHSHRGKDSEKIPHIYMYTDIFRFSFP